MNIFKILLTIVLPLTLSACGTMKDIRNANIGNEFEKSLRGYNQLVRWHELDSAASTYVSPGFVEDYRKKSLAAADVNITGYRVKKMECDPVTGEATAAVELEYYHPPSVKVLNVEDLQKWSYEGQEGSRAWRLKSLLPDFK